MLLTLILDVADLLIQPMVFSLEPLSLYAPSLCLAILLDELTGERRRPSPYVLLEPLLLSKDPCRRERRPSILPVLKADTFGYVIGPLKPARIAY